MVQLHVLKSVRRKVGNVETWQVYGFDGELLAEYAANAAPSSPQKEYGYRNGQLLITATIETGWGSPPTLHDNPLVVAATTLQSRHITELRAAIDALRTHLGMSAFSWQQLAATGDWIKADSILEMRTALDQALGAPPLGYSAGLAQGLPIKAIHIQELRDRVLAAWSSGSSTQVNWMVSDQLGTPRMIFDQTGSLSGVSRHDYLPFGEELFAGTGGRTTGLGYTNNDGARQKFTLKERDNETGLDYFGARYYASMQGRFTSPDPLLSSGKSLQPQSWNRYSYCVNDPLKYVDPKGLIWGKKKTSDTNTEYVWFEGNEVGEGYDVVTEFYVEGVIDGRSVGLRLNPDGPRAWWKQILLNADPALALTTNNSDYFVKGYEVGETRAQWAERSRTDAVDMMPNQAFDVGLFFAGGRLGTLNRAGAGSAAEGTTTLYRAVSNAEFEQMMRTGTFEAGANSVAGKHFAETAEHAAQWGLKLEGKGAFRVVDAQIPTVQAEKFMRWESLDGIGPARYAELPQLKSAVIGKGP